MAAAVRAASRWSMKRADDKGWRQGHGWLEDEAEIEPGQGGFRASIARIVDFERGRACIEGAAKNLVEPFRNALTGLCAEAPCFDAGESRRRRDRDRPWSCKPDRLPASCFSKRKARSGSASGAEQRGGAGGIDEHGERREAASYRNLRAAGRARWRQCQCSCRRVRQR